MVRRLFARRVSACVLLWCSLTSWFFAPAAGARPVTNSHGQVVPFQQLRVDPEETLHLEENGFQAADGVLLLFYLVGIRLHGNFCGPGTTNYDIAPTDALDHLCFLHDRCYQLSYRDNCWCDLEFVRASRELEPALLGTQQLFAQAIAFMFPYKPCIDEPLIETEPLMHLAPEVWEGRQPAP